MTDHAQNMLPPKFFNSTIPTCSSIRCGSDELISSLLKINNFDSISSIKDESLDIDLSACVTITPTALVNGNSLSSSDFWRDIDESAQIPEKGEVSLINVKNESSEELSNIFAGNFLRPDPPCLLVSPKKKTRPIRLAFDEQCITVADRGENLLTDRIRKVPQCPQMSLFIKQEALENISLNKIPVRSSENIKVSKFDTHSFKFNNIDGLNNVADKTIIPSTVSFALSNKSDQIKCSENATNQNSSVDSNELVHSQAVRHLSIQKKGELQDSNVFSTDNFKCVECKNIFDQEKNLKKHMRTHRNNSEVRKDIWKKCPECGKCLKLGSMWMHRKIHSDNRKYECEVCGQKFVQKINLTHHSRIHTSEKPFECPECKKRFQERSHLQRHQKYHAQTRSYRCDKCGKMYKTERCLKVHNLVHLERRPFACTVCDKSFISNSKLKQHLNIHTGARPFKCNYCPRDFTNFPNWLKHTRRRHKVDHKTGEQLENIPSYCSKKSASTKLQKSQKSQDITNRKDSDDIVYNGLEKKTQTKSNDTVFSTNRGSDCSRDIEIDSSALFSNSHSNSKALPGKLKKKNMTQILNTTFTSYISNQQINISDENISSSENVGPQHRKNQSSILSSKLYKRNYANNCTNNIYISVDDNAVINCPNIDTTTSSNGTDPSIAVVISSQFNPFLNQNHQIPSISKVAIGASTSTTQSRHISISSEIVPPNNSITKSSTKRERKNIQTKNLTFFCNGTNGSQTMHVDQTISDVATGSKDIRHAAPLKLDGSDHKKHLLNNFLDLHCLSITSAEELIMEQALEMEECGLYDVSNVFH